MKQTCYVKFLGVLLDENLSWKYHLTELSKKLARTCGMFYKVRHFLPINVLICLYNSLFSPFLQYGILVWGLTYETYINPVFLLQKGLLEQFNFHNLKQGGGSLSSDSLTTERAPPISNSLHTIYPVLCSVLICLINFKCRICINFVCVILYCSLVN